MSDACAKVRRQLAETPDDPAVVAHLAGCAGCVAVRDALRRVDEGLASLGAVEPSAALVQSTLDRVTAPRRRWPWVAGWSVGLASAMAGLLAMVLVQRQPTAPSPVVPTPTGDGWRGPSAENDHSVETDPSVEADQSEGLPLLAKARSISGKQRQKVPDGTRGFGEEQTGEVERVSREQTLKTGTLAHRWANVIVEGAVEPRNAQPPRDEPGDATAHRRDSDKAQKTLVLIPVDDSKVVVSDLEISRGEVGDELSALDNRVSGLKEKVFKGKARLDLLQETVLGGEDALGRDSVSQIDLRSRPAGGQIQVDGKLGWAGNAEKEGEHFFRYHAGSNQPAYALDLPSQDAFRGTLKPPVGSSTTVVPPSGGLDVNGRFETLTADQGYIAAQGYFENTYVPGDPQLAWLRAQVSAGLTLDGRLLDPLAGMAPYPQPVDAPTETGLALAVDADQSALEGPGRVTVQVTLRGADRHATRRPPVRAALVVDLRETPTEPQRRALWSLAETLAEEAAAGDELTLFIAGAPSAAGGVALSVTTARAALARALQGEGAVRLSLADALRAAGEKTAVGPDAAVGASAVLMATTGALPGLEDQAHALALAGTTVSPIGVGAGTDGVALSRLAAAGQGRRYLVASPGEAARTAREELSAAGRTVARAVRLRIRLADGVQLRRVVGSGVLDAVGADKVRAAEVALDRRVAATAGIRSDRGHDEDGVQIVIPEFAAGDTHVVLLEVDVAGPGPVADVRARYKDLVALRNAEATARLALRSGEHAPSARTQAVSRSLIGQALAEDLRRLRGDLGRLTALRGLVERHAQRPQAARWLGHALAYAGRLRR
jgi:hypothetical protein